MRLLSLLQNLLLSSVPRGYLQFDQIADMMECYSMDIPGLEVGRPEVIW